VDPHHTYNNDNCGRNSTLRYQKNRKGDGTCYRRKKWPIRAQDVKEEAKPHVDKWGLQIMKMAIIK
jgi:hypothetical protein